MLVTNAEPGEWLNKMLVQYWHSFVHPKLLNTMLRSVQGKLDEVVDQGVLSLWVEKFHLGLAPPVLVRCGGDQQGRSCRVTCNTVA